MRIVVVVLPLLTLAACATPRNRVETGLIAQGVRPGVARCMADEMTKRLSVDQLRKLGRAAPLPGERATNLSAAEYLERARRIGDVEVIGVTTSVAAICALIN